MLPTQQPSSSISKTPKPSIPLPFIAMKDRPSLSSYGAIYIPPHLRLRSVVTSANYNNNSGPVAPKLRENTPPTPTTLQTPLPEKRSSRYVSAYDDAVSEEGSDREFEVPSLPSGSHNDNIDEWKRKLTMFLNDKSKQELISREKKDRRDFEKIAVLASRMGLYSHVYAKVVVFSKVPLPNYRYDLDDRRPQREVSMPITMFRQVDAYFEEYLNQKSRVNKSFSDLSFARSSSSGSIGTDEGLFEQPEPLASSKTVAEKVLRWRSLEMLDQQQAWQESPEGKRMLEFRSSLPAYKEREAILSVISRNQVVIISGETGCGKTTQIPQFILESEIESVRGVACNIICTQPRRISAMSVSEKVASERGEKLGESVGYKVRLKGMKGKDTHLLFCTTGILLRLLADRNLQGVTHVIVDEIHDMG